MLPVGFAALVVKAFLFGINGGQPPRRAAGSAKISESRTKISTVGWLRTVCTRNAAGARARRLDWGFRPACSCGRDARDQAPRRPPGRLAAEPLAPPRRNRRSVREIHGT